MSATNAVFQGVKMRTSPKLKRVEIYLIAAVGAALVLEAAYVFSGSFTAADYAIPPTLTEAPSGTDGSFASDSASAPLEPALRTLDGVVSHG